jgi:hypothetical protein
MSFLEHLEDLRKLKKSKKSKAEDETRDEEGGQQFGAQRRAQYDANEAVLHRRAASICSRACSERALSHKRGR